MRRIDCKKSESYDDTDELQMAILFTQLLWRAFYVRRHEFESIGETEQRKVAGSLLSSGVSPDLLLRPEDRADVFVRNVVDFNRLNGVMYEDTELT
jgi:hypothetical protein